MITSIYQVKVYAGGFDGISDTQPDVDFDESAGYSVGYILLVEDGTTWKCSDATDGAAIWGQDTTRDEPIFLAARALTEFLPVYLNKWFGSANDWASLSGADFTGGTIKAVGSVFTATFLPGDTLQLAGSRRNDGYYDVTAVTDDEITVNPVVPVAIVDGSPMDMAPHVYPAGLQAIVARMAWFDVYVRPLRGAGLASESVGSYSWSAMERVGGIDYPSDLTAGLSAYRRPKVV